MPRSWILLLVTLTMSAIFAAIVVRIYRRRNRDEAERPKYRMLEDD